jgi:hypothetical protein
MRFKKFGNEDIPITNVGRGTLIITYTYRFFTWKLPLRLTDLITTIDKFSQTQLLISGFHHAFFKSQSLFIGRLMHLIV